MAPHLELHALPEQDHSTPHERRATFALKISSADRARDRPLRLVLAVDRSSSMKGPKLEKARRAAAVAVDMLGEEDEIALLAFDQEVNLLLPPVHANAEGKAMAHRQLLALRSGYGTALCDASKHAAEVACGAVEGHAIVLTDGYPFVSGPPAGSRSRSFRTSW